MKEAAKYEGGDLGGKGKLQVRARCVPTAGRCRERLVGGGAAGAGTCMTQTPWLLLRLEL